MRKVRPKQSKGTIELTKQGVFQISSTPAGDTERKKIARLIRLRAIGKRDFRWRHIRPAPVSHDSR